MIVQHHIKYKEIHGVDEIILMDRGEHRRLHNRLRKEGKCNVAVDDLYVIASKAHRRTESCKEVRQKWRRQPEHAAKEIEYSKQYNKKNVRRIVFTEGLGLCRHMEYIIYNEKTGNVCILCKFEANHPNRFYELKDKNPAPVVADKEYEVM